jgi:hypothetical protein
MLVQIFYYELEERCRVIVEMDSCEQKDKPKRKRKEKEGENLPNDGKERNTENEEETYFLKDEDKTSVQKNASSSDFLKRGKRIKRVSMGQFDFVSPLRARRFLESRDLLHKLQKVFYLFIYCRCIFSFFFWFLFIFKLFIVKCFCFLTACVPRFTFDYCLSIINNQRQTSELVADRYFG